MNEAADRRRALALLAAATVLLGAAVGVLLPAAPGRWVFVLATAGLVGGLAAAARLAYVLLQHDAGHADERELLHGLVEGTTDGIFVKDREGRFLLVNSAFAALHGLRAEDVQGRQETEVFPTDHARHFLEEDARVMAQGVSHIAEFTGDFFGRPITTLTTKTPLRDREGQVRGVIGITRDISERKRAEDEQRDALEARVRERTAELRSANAILQAVIEGTTDLVTVKDREGRYLLVNSAAARNVGRSPREVLGLHDRDFFPPPVAEALQDADRRVMDSGESRTVEDRIPGQGGERILLTTKAPYRDSHGETIGVIAIGRDVTESRHGEEALRRSQKLESLGLLAGGVAHDFNNLLVAMLGQTSLGLSRLPPGSPARENLEKAVRAAERAADLTRQMLAYSGRGHFQVTSLDLNALILDNLHLFEVAVPKNVALRSELPPSLPWIEADVGQIQQVVMNLITNAAEAIGERPGTVTVTTGTRHVGARDTLLWRHTGEPLAGGTYVALEVQDDGQGMSPEVLERIFDPFFTTKFTGRGLGLAAVLGIVRGHKGGLQVESRKGRGTLFRLVFPQSLRASAPGENSAATATQTAGTVLVIDDEAMVREAVADVLEAEGIPYHLAANGEAGVALLDEHRREIGLVLLDLSMPGRSGEETFAALRKVDEVVPVLLSSGYTEEEVRRRFREKDLAGFLQKPYQFPALVAEVKRCLRPRA